MIGGGGDFDLGALVEFVLVPAVRDAALDAADSRTGGFRQLVELLVRTRLDVGEQLAALREEIDARYAEIISNDGDTILAETFTLPSERLAALAPARRSSCVGRHSPSPSTRRRSGPRWSNPTSRPTSAGRATACNAPIWWRCCRRSPRPGRPPTVRPIAGC
jgi:hypothetical protein